MSSDCYQVSTVGKKVYITVVGDDGYWTMYFKRTDNKNSVVYGTRPSWGICKDEHSTYHPDGGGRFKGTPIRREMLSWKTCDAVILEGGDFHPINRLVTDDGRLVEKSGYSLKINENLCDLQYNLWLYKPPREDIPEDLDRSDIKIVRDGLFRVWTDCWVYIIVFRVI